MRAGELSADEKTTLRLLKKKPLKIPEIAAELSRDPKITYKMIKGLENKQLIKIGYVRISKKKFRVEAFCYLPQREETLKAGKYGMVYLPIEKVVEAKPQADEKVVLGYIEKIDSAISLESWVECRSWIFELRQLCIHNRTGHIAELLGAISRYVGTDDLFEDEDTREELAMTMTYILENEKAVGSTTAYEVAKQFLEAVRKIALYDRKNGLRYSLRFLGKTELSGSVDIVTDLISQRPQEITGNLESEIHYVLFGSELGKKHGEHVQERLVELSSSENQAVRSVVVHLQKRSRLYS